MHQRKARSVQWVTSPWARLFLFLAAWLLPVVRVAVGRWCARRGPRLWRTNHLHLSRTRLHGHGPGLGGGLGRHHPLWFRAGHLHGPGRRTHARGLHACRLLAWGLYGQAWARHGYRVGGSGRRHRVGGRLHHLHRRGTARHLLAHRAVVIALADGCGALRRVQATLALGRLEGRPQHLGLRLGHSRDRLGKGGCHAHWRPR